MQWRLVLAFAIVAAFFLGSSLARADAPEVGFILPAKPKPFEPVWNVLGFTEVRFTPDAEGISLTHGIDIDKAVGKHVRIGAELTLPAGAKADEYCGEMYWSPYCTYIYYALQGIVELHAAPRFYVDPWVRAGFGPMVEVNREDAWKFRYYLPHWGFIVSAAAGVDFHKSGFVGGLYGTFAAFAGRGDPLVGGGVRLGGEF